MHHLKMLIFIRRSQGMLNLLSGLCRWARYRNPHIKIMKKITAASKAKYMWGKLLYNNENTNKSVLNQGFGFLDYLHTKQWCRQMVWVPNK